MTPAPAQPRAANYTDDPIAAALASADDAFFEWDIETDELRWSDGYYALLGLNRLEEPRDSSRFFDRLHPLDRPVVRAQLNRHLTDGHPYSAQYRLRHADGAWRYFASRAHATRDADGAPIRLVGVVTDVTDGSLSRRALEESERRFTDLAANIPVAIFQYVIDAKGSDRVEYMSPGCLDLWEMPQDAITTGGCRLWEMIDPQDLPGVQASVAHSRDTMTPWAHQWRITTPSGQRKWLEARGRPAPLPDGGVMWNTVAFDVTREVDAQEALAATRQHLSAIAEQIPGAILQYRRTAAGQDSFDYLSPGFAALWEMPVADALTDLAAVWARIVPEDAVAMQIGIAESASALTTWRAQFRLRCAGERIKWIEARGAPIRRDDGATVWNTVLLDVTEKAEADIAAATALRAAQEANRAKSLFLATMSHEIRTPMNGVTGMTALLAATPLDDKQKRMVEIIASSNAALLDIVNQLLDYARADVASVELDPAPFDLRALLDDTMALCAARLDPARVATAIDYPDDAPSRLIGDGNKLRQVLVNLLNNAAKFTDDGRIDAVVRHDGAMLRITIHDTGVGVDPARLETIFEPFTQSDASATRRHSGSGLGLTISRRIMRAMGGDVTASSALGRGSVFTLTAPLLPAEAD